MKHQKYMKSKARCVKKRALAMLGILFSLSLIAGCGPSTPVVQKPDEPSAKIEITGNDQMKFDVTSFSVNAGQRVEVVFKNIGTMPKESMGHCWTLLEQGTDLEKFTEAGIPHASKGYIAPEMKNRVLATSKILGPGESETVTFIAPTRRGAYTYVCIFPGHPAMMQGVMTVL